jgi:hypothetical protein
MMDDGTMKSGCVGCDTGSYWGDTDWGDIEPAEAIYKVGKDREQSHAPKPAPALAPTHVSSTGGSSANVAARIGTEHLDSPPHDEAQVGANNLDSPPPEAARIGIGFLIDYNDDMETRSGRLDNGCYRCGAITHRVRNCPEPRGFSRRGDGRDGRRG